jgi:prepilin peptidase CpaA
MLFVTPRSVVCFLTCAGLALLGLAALHDVLARTIPNWICAALAAAGIGALWLTPSAPGRLLAAALLFAAAVLLWRAGWLGGGDAKLLGAIGLLLPPDRVVGAVLTTACTGSVLALPYLICRGRIARPGPGRPHGLPARAWRAERFRLRRGGPLPYGVAIAAGAAVGLLGPGS